MDVAALLREARERAGLSQQELAERAGASASQLSRYASGRMTPTTATLDRLVAACGLQVRAVLEPLLADVDARVDTLLAGRPAVLDEYEAGQRRNLVLTLDADPEAHYRFASHAGRGPAASWAFDSHTALQLQSLAASGEDPAVVVELDEASRSWLRTIHARGYDECGQVDWRDSPQESLARATRDPLVSALGGLVWVRLVESLPPTVHLAVPWIDRPVPVLTVDAVEQAHPQHAEVLARLRDRRRREDLGVAGATGFPPATRSDPEVG